MAKTTQQLEATFVTGHTVTQDDFRSIFDSFLNISDNEQTNIAGTLSIGATNPSASLAVEGSPDFRISGRVKGTAGKKTLKQASASSATQFTTELSPGDLIHLNGVVYQVSTITNDTTLTLSTELAANITSTAITKLNPIFQLSDDSGKPVFLVANNGNVGLGSLSPTIKLNVDGDVQATTYRGSGANLTDLPAASLTGAIPATSLPASISASLIDGAISVENLPAQIPASKISGKLSPENLPASDNSGATNLAIKRLYASALIFDHPTEVPSVDLHWEIETDLLDDLEMQWVANRSIQSHVIGLDGASTDLMSLDLMKTTTFTLIAHKDGSIVDQKQLTIEVIQSPHLYVQSIMEEFQQPAARGLVRAVGYEFFLHEMTDENITQLASAFLGTEYAEAENLGGLFQAIPAFYRSMGYDWNPATQGEILIQVFTT